MMYGCIECNNQTAIDMKDFTDGFTELYCFNHGEIQIMEPITTFGGPDNET